MLNRNQVGNFVQRYQKVLIFFSLILFSLVLFSPSYTNENFFWDDDRFIFMNPSLLQAPNWYVFWNVNSTFFKSWPLGYSIFWLLIKYSPLSSIVFFKTLNIIFHGINAFLIFNLNKKLKFKYPYLLSLIFLAHALNVETVSWIFQLLSILALTFFLLSLNSLINFLENNKIITLILSLLFFTFSLWTKSIAILTPFLFLIIFWVYKTNYKKYLLLLPFFIISLFVGVINTDGTQIQNGLEIDRGHTVSLMSKINKTLGHSNKTNGHNAITENNDKAYFDYIFKKSNKVYKYKPENVFSQGVWHYLSKLILPVGLTYIYPKQTYNFILTLGAMLLLIIIPTCFFYKYNNRQFILIPAMASSFLAPYLGITSITFFYWSNVSDRYTYFFVIVLVVSLGLWGNVVNNIKVKKILLGYIFLLSCLCLYHGQKFNKPALMYEEILAYKPHPVIYSLLFEQYYMALDYKRADAVLKEGLSKFPDNVNLNRDTTRLESLRKFYENNQLTP